MLKKKKRFKKENPSILVKPLPDNCRILDTYWVKEPYAHVVIAEEKDTGVIRYYALEERLLESEKDLYNKIASFLEFEIDLPDEEEIDRMSFVVKEAEKLMNRYKKLRPSNPITKGKILYYIERNVAGFGPIHVLMLDPNIEDISCNGVNTPIYVWHRRFESIPTNISFLTEKALDDFVIRLAHMAGKHISSAHPIIDATLPGKHRLAATFMHEVTTRGSTFCIRKFREIPFSIIELRAGNDK